MHCAFKEITAQTTSAGFYFTPIDLIIEVLPGPRHCGWQRKSEEFICTEKENLVRFIPRVHQHTNWTKEWLSTIGPIKNTNTTYQKINWLNTLVTRRWWAHVSSNADERARGDCNNKYTPYLSSHFFVQLMRYSETFLMFSSSPLQ